MKLSRRDFVIGTAVSAGMACPSDKGVANKASAAGVSGRPLLLIYPTIIDGTGARPYRAHFVIVRNGRIAAIERHGNPLPDVNAVRVNCDRKFLLPGLVDCNVHLFGHSDPRRFWNRRTEISIEAAQLYLSCGVTTIRETSNFLDSSLAAREAINAGRVIGPRLLTSGNIVGWGGPYSATMNGSSFVEDWQRPINEAMTLGVGENLIDASPTDIETALEAYIERGVDFIKYGGTAHTNSWMIFTPAQQRAIIATAHRHGLRVDTHAQGVGPKEISVDAGVDLIQHPDYDIPLMARPFPPDLMSKIVRRRVVCALNSGFWTTGDQYRAALVSSSLADRNFANREVRSYRQRASDLIGQGACVAVGSDATYFPEVTNQIPFKRPGRTTVEAVKGLVELGCSPLGAIRAATFHGAIACGAERQFGSVERGKAADMIVLDADPSADIGALDTLSEIVVGGKVVDRSGLPSI